MIEMKFVSYDVDSIDVKNSWMATNAQQEVDIIENINGVYELWVGENFISLFETFEIAKRNAETLVPFNVKFD